MTAADFRRLALALPDASEGRHMGHADFRVGGKIFATLGYPGRGYAAVMLSPADQDLFVRHHPTAFAPAPGAWGKQGSTTVVLRAATRTAVRTALESAWARRAPARLKNG